MAFIKSCGCALCDKIDRAISQRVLAVDEVSEIARHLLPADAPVDNVARMCASCHGGIETRRYKARVELGLPPLCPECAKGNVKEYVGANIQGDLVKTTNPQASKIIRDFHKGSHAIQG